MKVNFDIFVENSEGEAKKGDPVNKLMAETLEGLNKFRQGDRAALWNLVGKIRTQGEVDLNEEELRILKTHWNKVNTRLDLDMKVRKLLEMD